MPQGSGPREEARERLRKAVGPTVREGPPPGRTVAPRRTEEDSLARKFVAAVFLCMAGPTREGWFEIDGGHNIVRQTAAAVREVILRQGFTLTTARSEGGYLVHVRPSDG